MAYNLDTAPGFRIEEQAVNQDGVIDAVNVSEEELRELLKTSQPLRFDWENKWLRGD